RGGRDGPARRSGGECGPGYQLPVRSGLQRGRRMTGMPRILAEHGNVIAVDFRPHASPGLSIRSEILYRDDAVMLTRTTGTLGDEPILVMHFMGDLKTGRITNL